MSKEEKQTVENVETNDEHIETDNTEQEKQTEKKEPELKYSDDDVDEIIDKKFAKWQKQQEEKINELKEAQKLEKMNEDEKADYTIKKLQKELEGYKKRENQSAMAKVAQSMLVEEGFNISDDLVSNLITDEAESTKDNVKDFTKLLKEAVEKEVNERLKGKSPKVKTTRTKTAKATKGEILGIKDPVKRQEAIANNLDLFS